MSFPAPAIFPRHGPPTEIEVRHIHETFCRLTGVQLPFMASYFWPWELFLLKFDEEDLRRVIAFIKWKQSQGHPCRSLHFRSFIRGADSIESFSEDLAEAKARERRNPPVKKVMKFGGPTGYPPEQKTDTTKHVSAVAPALKSPEEIEAWIQELKRKEGLI